MILWRDQKVVHQLSGLSVLEVDVLLLAHGLHEVLVDQLSDAPPLFAVLHQQQVIALCDEVPDVGHRAVTVQTTLPVQQLLNHMRVGNDECCVGEALKCVNAAILLCPFRESALVSPRQNG